MNADQRRPRLDSTGLVLGEQRVPLHSGSVDYFRLSRRAWRPALESLKQLGVRLVDTVVPWSVHERARGELDFGHDNPRLDLAGFLDLAEECGLFAIVRLGPFSTADLAFGGIPERVVWSEPCQARSPSGAPVMVPSLPLAFPAPSLASRAFQEEAALWLAAAADQIASRTWPDGPVVLSYVEPELAVPLGSGSRNGDYHPDAIAQYRRFLRQRYGTRESLRRSHRNPGVSFETVAPPALLDTAEPDALAPHLDWSEFQDAELEAATYRFRAVLDRHGLGAIPKACSVPRARSSADPVRLSRVVDLVTLARPLRAPEREPSRAAREVTALATRAAQRGVPPVASLSAGFSAATPPFPESEDAFAALTALAYGVRGLDVHLAVQRDRWIGGPIDVRGRARPSADFWRRLLGALDRTRFHELERRTSVHLVVPRITERLAGLCRVVHSPLLGALGPDADAALELLEGELDPTRGALLDTERFLSTVESALEAARVPFAHFGAESLERALEGSAWVIVPCPGALDPMLTAKIGERVLASGKISVGPHPPERDELMRPSNARLPALSHPAVPLLLPGDPADLTELIRTTATGLGLHRLESAPIAVRTTLHVDSDGRPRVLFVLNPSHQDVEAVAHAPSATAAADALTGEPRAIDDGRVTVQLRARTAMMLSLS